MSEGEQPAVPEGERSAAFMNNGKDDVLFRVIVKVRPAVQSESFWKAQYGWAVGWIMAVSSAAAAQGVQSYIQNLGTYEFVDAPSAALQECQHPLTDQKFDQYKEAAVEGRGNLFTRWCATGVDEEDSFLEATVFPEDLMGPNWSV